MTVPGSPEAARIRIGEHVYVHESTLKIVAWRVKDFADGWVLCHSEEEARGTAYMMADALVQPLYVKELL